MSLLTSDSFVPELDILSPAALDRMDYKLMKNNIQSKLGKLLSMYPHLQFYGMAVVVDMWSLTHCCRKQERLHTRTLVAKSGRSHCRDFRPSVARKIFGIEVWQEG